MKAHLDCLVLLILAHLSLALLKIMSSKWLRGLVAVLFVLTVLIVSWKTKAWQKCFLFHFHSIMSNDWIKMRYKSIHVRHSVEKFPNVDSLTKTIQRVKHDKCINIWNFFFFHFYRKISTSCFGNVVFASKKTTRSKS